MCTLLGCIRGERTLIASTSDNPYNVRNQVVCRRSTRYPYLAVKIATDPASDSVPWDGMLTRGLNAAGLAYVYAYVHEADSGYGLQPQQWTEELLSTCTEVDSALQLMNSYVGQILPGNYLLADQRRKLVLVEIDRRQMMTKAAQGGSVVSTNAWSHLPRRVQNKWGGETASDRLRRAQYLMASPGDDPGSTFGVLRDHSDGGTDSERPYGVSICNHGYSQGTISAELLEPSHLRLWWTYGWPCGNVRGYETLLRRSWGQFVAFDLDKSLVDGELTTLDGQITPAGVSAIGGIEKWNQPKDEGGGGGDSSYGRESRTSASPGFGGQRGEAAFREANQAN